MNEPFKRFLLIEIEWYYPQGGIGDVENSVDTLEESSEWFNKQVSEAKEKECQSTTFQVFDCEERKTIFEWPSKR